MGPQLEPHPPVSKGRGGGAGRAVCARLRPVLRGLSDFASKGERCDTYVCKEGPFLQGSAKDLDSGTRALVGGGFPLVFPHFARSCPEYVFYSSILLPFGGEGEHLGHVNTLGLLPQRSLPSFFSVG